MMMKSRKMLNQKKENCPQKGIKWRSWSSVPQFHELTILSWYNIDVVVQFYRNSKHTEEDQEDKLKTCSNHEDDKQKIDSLWASFKEPVDSKEGKSSTLMVSSDVKQTASKIFEFAGEEVEYCNFLPFQILGVTKLFKVALDLSSWFLFCFRVQEKTKPIPSSSQQNLTKRPPLRSGGLSSFTSQLTNKKSKLSTLEKSKLDWDRFKSDEGIAEDLKSFNQGKKGFLERQAFLERADVKQFEIEKSLRAGRKPNQH